MDRCEACGRERRPLVWCPVCDVSLCSVACFDAHRDVHKEHATLSPGDTPPNGQAIDAAFVAAMIDGCGMNVGG